MPSAGTIRSDFIASALPGAAVGYDTVCLWQGEEE
jgi:hypothetical protein